LKEIFKYSSAAVKMHQTAIILLRSLLHLLDGCIYTKDRRTYVDFFPFYNENGQGSELNILKVRGYLHNRTDITEFIGSDTRCRTTKIGLPSLCQIV
jgi:hypothetical protein